MTIEARVLGEPGRDNAAFVRVDSGQALARLLLDCGQGCPDALGAGEVLATDHLLFSHLHMDHVGGFDSFFRRTYDRTTVPNHVWGPPGTAAILQHRFQGFLWNLHHTMAGTWLVHDVHDDRIDTSRFELSEAFAVQHPAGSRPRSEAILETAEYRVEALAMDHLTPSLAYVIRESERANVDTARLTELGLRPGAWLAALKGPQPDDAEVEAGGARYRLGELRERLLVRTAGQSVAYLTDFLLDEPAMERLPGFLRGCDLIICESQYRHADLPLAQRTHHMTATQAAQLARRAGAGRLVLFHLSDRYTRHVWPELLAEARAVFPNTHFPDHWQLQDTVPAH